MKSDGLRYLNRAEKRALAQYLARLRAEYKDQVQHVILYGSKVRGDFDEESDIDLFIVLKQLDSDQKWSLTRLGVDVDLEHNVLLGDFIVSQERYNRMAELQEPLYKTLMLEGIDLWTRTPMRSLRRRVQPSSRKG